MKNLTIQLITLFAFQFLVPLPTQAQQKPELIVQTGHTAVAHPIGFSPDGKILASTSIADETVKLWDVGTGRELKTLLSLSKGARDSKSRTQYEGRVKLSPNGKILASDSEGEYITLWDMSTGQKLILPDCILCVGDTPFTFSPDSKMIISRMFAGWVLSDLQTGKSSSFVNSRDGLFSPLDELIGFSPDGKTLAFRKNDKTIKLWNVAAVKELKILNERIKGVNEFEFAPDGKTMIAADKDRTIKLFDVASEQELKTLKGSSDGIVSFKFSPDGKMLAGRGENFVKLWNVATGEELKTVQGLEKSDFHITLISFSPDGKLLVANSGKIIRMWNVINGEELKSLEGQDHLLSVGFSPHGKLLTSVSFKDLLSFSEYTFKLWDFATGKELKSLQGCPFATFSADGNTLATGCADGSIKITEVKTGKELKSLDKHSADLIFVTFSPDGKTLASTISGGVARSKFDLITKDIFVILATVNYKSSTNFYALGNENRNIKLWDVSSGRELRKLQGHTDIIRSIAFSPDGQMLASVSEDKTVRLWGATTGQGLKTLQGHTAIVTSVAFSQDSKTLASGSYDGTVKLWDVATGKNVKTLKTLKHPSIPMSVSFSPDGTMLAMGYWTKDLTNNIIVWDAATGKEIKTLEWREAMVISVAFSPDGKKLATRSVQDGAIKIWDISSGQELKTFKKDDPNGVREVFAIVPDLYRNNDDETITADGKIQIKRGANARLDFIEVKTGKSLASLIALDESDWAVVTPDGRFDTNKLEKPEGLHWLLLDVPLAPLSFEVFMRDYFEPKLLPRLLKCTKEENCDREFKPVRDLSTLNRTQPNIKIKRITPTASPGTVEVSAEVENVISKFQKDSLGRKLSSGVYDVRLFRDGQLVAHSTSDEKLQTTFRAYKNFEEELAVWREAHKVNLVNGKKAFTFKVKLPKDQQNKQVEFSAYAFNDDRVKSDTVRTTYTIPPNTNLQSEPRKAYVITFGVNKYDNPAWNLQFAGNDARAMGEVVSANLRQRREFAEVVEIALIADSETLDNKTIEKRDATKGNIQTVLERLGGKTPAAGRLKDLEKAVGAKTLQKIRPAQPDDMVLIAFSSHGYADKNGVFYIVPTDIGTESVKRVTPKMLSRSISSDELSLWLRDVDAGEMVMIVDACHAASAVEGSEFKPGPMGSRGLGQLAFDKGMRILAATQSDNVALENQVVRQGLLTYALVQDGIEARQADYKPKDRIINISEWLSYGVERVPKLYEEVRAGNVQNFGSGMRWQAKVMSASQNGRSASKDLEEVIIEAKAQQPSLFDFTRQRSEVALVNLQ